MGEQRILPSMMRTPEGDRQRRQRRDEGIDRAAMGAPPGWVERALAAVAKTSRVMDEFTTDDVRWVFDVWYEGSSYQPRDGRAWGAVMRTAIGRGLVEKTGEYRQTRRPEAHCRPIPVYRRRCDEAAATS